MSAQLSLFKSQIEEKYMENGILKLELNINPQLTSFMSIPRGEIAKMKMTRNYENPIITAGFKSLKGCKVEALDIKEIKVHGDEIPSYTDTEYISHGHVMLLDQENKVCHLLDSLFNSVSFHKLSGCPWKLCAVGQSEIAVSMPWKHSIQFLSVKDNAITRTRKVTTRYDCYGIAIVSRDEMVVSGPCGDNKKYYWSLITLDGKEKSYHEFYGEGSDETHVALNALETCLYISVYKDNSLHRFGIDGKKYFTFKHRDLLGPTAVAIDRDNNVYIVGSSSYNIFQLSADGVLIQIITDAVPEDPEVMRFNEDGDRFLLTCYESKDLHVFRLAPT